MEPQSNTKKYIIFILGGIFFITGITYGSFFSYTTYNELQSTKKQLTSMIQASKDAIFQLENKLNLLTLENQSLTNILTDEQKKNLDLEKDVKKSEKKIDTLEKLTTIDPELLKKYSKVFFLSENYTPPKLADVREEYKIIPDKDIKILRDVYPFLNNMLQDAEDEGIDLRVISGYRSFEEQTVLKSGYSVKYGTGANQFSADQGYSEHQLGTTVDFGTPEVTGAFLSFENSLAFVWLQDNAHKYGFILSYPKGNQYYQYEPWHWRFVGEDLAEDLYDQSKSFYELDQREIDEYLIKIFD